MRAATIALWATLQVLGIWCLPQLADGRIFVQALGAAGLALIQATATLGLGLALMRSLRCSLRDPLAESGAALFLGVGVVSLCALSLGLAGHCSAPLLRVSFSLLAVAASPLTSTWFMRTAQALMLTRALSPVSLILSALTTLLFALLALRAAMPPQAYDVLTYHLAVPKIWLREGAVFPVPGNMYSHQPFLGEMNFLVGLALFPGSMVVTATFMNIVALAATMGLVRALARSHGVGRGASGAAALLVGFTPQVYRVCTDALVDIWVVLGVVAALHLWHRWLRTRKLGTLIAAALMLGFLATVKQPAAVIWCTPIGLMCLWTLISRPLTVRGRILALATPIAFGALPVLVWCAKETAWSGNPFFPLGYGVFGGTGWSEAQATLLVGGHGLRGPLELAFWHDAWTRIETTSPYTGALLAAALLWAWRRRKRGVIPIVAVTIAAHLIWNLLAGSADRFALPMVALLTPLGVGGLWSALAWARRRLSHTNARWMMLLATLPILEFLRATSADPTAFRFAAIAACAVFLAALALDRARSATQAAVAALIPLALVASLVTSNEFPGLGSARYRLARLGEGGMPRQILFWLPHLQASRALNVIEKPAGKVMLVYEARTFHLDAPAVMGTVFDGQPLRDFVRGAAHLDEVLNRLREAGVTHVVINPIERTRLVNTYFGGGDEGDPFNITPSRPLWDFPTPLSEREWNLVEQFHEWAPSHQVPSFRAYPLVVRLPPQP